MRVILFLLPFLSFGQLNLISKISPELIPFPIDTTIQGDWFLMETMVSSDFMYDSIPVMRFEETGIKRITFSKDSLFIHPWNTRYYQRTEKYNYELKGFDINLYSGLKKRRIQLDQLQIVRCTPEVLILSSTGDLIDPLGYKSLTTYYTYYRNLDYKSEVAAFYGSWIACDDEFIDLFREEGQLDLILYRDSTCVSEAHRLALNIRRNEFKMNEEVEVSMSSQYSGVFLAGIEFFIDTKKKFVYISSNEIVVYSYEFLDSESIRLIYNQEESERLKVK